MAIDDRGHLALGLLVGLRAEGAHHVASFHAAVLRSGEPPVVVADDDIPAPPDRWELRTSGLWVESICEQAHRHWSYGLEAFGLAIDDPAELLGRGYGDRLAVGWELQFHGAVADVVSLDVEQPADATAGARGSTEAGRSTEAGGGTERQGTAEAGGSTEARGGTEAGGTAEAGGSTEARGGTEAGGTAEAGGSTEALGSAEDRGSPEGGRATARGTFDGHEPAGLDRQAGRVEGLVLFTGDSVPVGGPALRTHRWGSDGAGVEHPAGSLAAPNATGADPATSVALPTPDGVWWLSHGAGELRWHVDR